MKKILVFCLGLTSFVLVFCASSYAQYINYDSLVLALPKEVSNTVFSLTEQAESAQSRGEIDSAIMANQRIIALLPTFAPAYVTIAGLYGVQMKFRDEIIWASKAIAVDSSYINGYINLGNAYANLHSYDTATRIYMGASLIDPHSPLPAYSIGVLLEEQGEVNAALKNYIQATRIDTSFEAAFYNAAMMYADLKKFPEAKEMLRKALSINPYDKEADEQYQAIEKEEKEALSAKKKKGN